MSSKQVYDKEGTTNFQFTFMAKAGIRKKISEWHVFFTSGFISINSYNTQTHIKVNFPEEDHWVYEERESSVHNGSLCRGGEIKTKDFSLIVDVREYLSPDDPDFEPDYHEEGKPEGYLVLDSKINYISMSIPYKLALNLMKFMTGSTNLDGVCGVIKSGELKEEKSIKNFDDLLDQAKRGEIGWKDVKVSSLVVDLDSEIYMNSKKKILEEMS